MTINEIIARRFILFLLFILSSPERNRHIVIVCAIAGIHQNTSARRSACSVSVKQIVVVVDSLAWSLTVMRVICTFCINMSVWLLSCSIPAFIFKFEKTRLRVHNHRRHKNAAFITRFKIICAPSPRVEVSKQLLFYAIRTIHQYSTGPGIIITCCAMLMQEMVITAIAKAPRSIIIQLNFIAFPPTQ